MKLVKVGLGFLDFFDLFCPWWWIGRNDSIIGNEFMDKDMWIMGFVFVRRYKFDNEDEMKREAKRVIWGLKEI